MELLTKSRVPVEIRHVDKPAEELLGCVKVREENQASEFEKRMAALAAERDSQNVSFSNMVPLPSDKPAPSAFDGKVKYAGV